MKSDHEINGLISDYIKFQENSPSPFQVVGEIKASLTESCFIELDTADQWALEIGKSYFNVHADLKSIVAFRVGEQSPMSCGFNIACAHTDSPCLRFRMNPFSKEQHLQGIKSQIHGGIIARTWLDRPLIVAGAVHRLVREKGLLVIDEHSGLPLIQTNLVKSQRALAVIPDLAIHLDRDKNSQGKIDFETMLTAFFGTETEAEMNIAKFWNELGVDPDTFDGFELYLAPNIPHQIVGIDESMLVGPRHDDLAMVFATLAGMSCRPANKLQRTSVAGFFDAEETGSETSSGARSRYLLSLLKRITRAHPKSSQSGDCDQALAKSYLISADMAHAYHPSHGSKFDDMHRVYLNRGLVIKENANDRYATSAQTAAQFRGLCEMAEIPTQDFINRQDLGCGSTIGPCLAAQLGCLAVDIGAPMWAMHSTAETMGTKDLYYSKRLMQRFLSGQNEL